MITSDGLDVKGKTVLLRIDINSPIIDGKISDNPRIVEHAKTIRNLSDRGAKLVILAHQGRPGDMDFTSLEQHSKFLTKYVKRKVTFVPDIIGPYALKKIQKLTEGKILLLENIRLMSEESSERDHSKDIFVTTLASHADYFVNDAFSDAHRSHASMTGFPSLLKSAAGPIMVREYEAVSKFNAARPCIYLLGGAKTEECLDVMKFSLENDKVDKVLLSGVIAEDFLNPGKEIVKDLLSRFRDKIELPIDFAVEEAGKRKEVSPKDKGPYKDIGEKTAKKYASVIKEAKSLYLKGPCGCFENPLFEKGTAIVFKAVSKSNAFSLVGGGHTELALERLKINKRKISHISLAGGAVLEYLSKGSLPAIEALEHQSQPNSL